ncbi:MAG: hypothetical protein PHH37_08430 [Paludibacter sp.]|nr:hypothetical protein [Paludibacter sp.]
MRANSSLNYTQITFFIINNRRKALKTISHMEKQEVKLMESIKTVEDALNTTGMPAIPYFNEAPKELREYLKAVYEAVVITQALVGDWKADWNDDTQRKWFPWFRMSSGGFVFYAAYCAYSTAYAGNASRLCFPTYEMAEYAGKQFTEIYSRIILK